MANLAGPGGGSTAIDPYSDPGGGVGIGPPPLPPPTPPASSYPTGPAKKQSYYHAPPAAAAAPPDPWKDIPSAMHDQAVALVEKFMASAGWPKNIDANSAAMQLAKSGINLTASPFDAYGWLFDNVLGTKIDTKTMPWAQFGMLKDDYNSTVSKMDSVMFEWTGQQLSTQNLGANGGLWSGSPLWQAIRGGWLPDQIRNYATYGNPSGTGQMLANAQFSGDMPWLSVGQSYTQTLDQFQAFEEHAPTDKATLAAWWRFGQSAKQLSGAREAVAVPAPQKTAMTETR